MIDQNGRVKYRMGVLKRVSFFVAGLTVLLAGFMNTTIAAGSYSWTEQLSAGTRSWQYIASSADGTKLAVTVYGGSIWTSTDSGVTWTERTGAGSRNWRPIASSADGTKLAAGSWTGSNIWTSTDSGVTWTERTGAGSRNWASISSSADGTKLAAAANGGSIWTSTDSGVTWTERTGAGSVRLIQSSSNGAKLVAIAANGGSIWTSTDSGVTWTERVPFAGLHSWYTVTSNSDGTKLAAAEYGGSIWISTDSGVTWAERTGAGNKKWGTITSSADGSVLAAGDTGGSNNITISTDSGVSWEIQSDAGSHTWMYITMSTDGSKITATDDDGSIWTAHHPDDLIDEPTEDLTTVSLPNAVNANPVSVTTPNDTDITCSTALTEENLNQKDPGYMYPVGLVRFCFTAANSSNEVIVTFATDLRPNDVIPRHFNAVTGTYTTLTNAILSQTSLNGNEALQVAYTIADNGPLDEDAAMGSIIDPIGLAVAVGAPSTGIGPTVPWVSSFQGAEYAGQFLRRLNAPHVN